MTAAISARDRRATANDVGVCRPPASSLKVSNFKHVPRGPSLRGFCTVTWRRAGLVFRGVPVFVDGDGKGWCGLPAAPQLDSAGRHQVVNGRKQFQPLIVWKDRARGEEFSRQVILLLLKKYPHALDAETTEAAA